MGALLLHEAGRDETQLVKWMTSVFQQAPVSPRTQCTHLLRKVTLTSHKQTPLISQPITRPTCRHQTAVTKPQTSVTSVISGLCRTRHFPASPWIRLFIASHSQLAETLSLSKQHRCLPCNYLIVLLKTAFPKRISGSTYIGIIWPNKTFRI